MSVTEPYAKTVSQGPKNDFSLKSTPSFGSTFAGLTVPYT